MFNELLCLHLYVGSLLLCNRIWKQSSFGNTTTQWIEPSIISGLCMGCIPYILHLLFLPTDLVLSSMSIAFFNHGTISSSTSRQLLHSAFLK